MRCERDGLKVDRHGDAIVLVNAQGRALTFSNDEARWLMHTALPAVLADVPSDAREKVSPPPEKPAKPSIGEHIEGQLVIE